MPTVNEKFLRAELQATKEQIEALRQSGKVSPEADAVFQVLMPQLTLLLAVWLENTTRKTSHNSSIPPSQVDADETAQRAKPGHRAAKASDRIRPNLQKVTIEETVTVEACDRRGSDLWAVDPIDRERRVPHDIVFQLGIIPSTHG